MQHKTEYHSTASSLILVWRNKYGQWQDLSEFWWYVLVLVFVKKKKKVWQKNNICAYHLEVIDVMKNCNVIVSGISV